MSTAAMMRMRSTNGCALALTVLTSVASWVGCSSDAGVMTPAQSGGGAGAISTPPQGQAGKPAVAGRSAVAGRAAQAGAGAAAGRSAGAAGAAGRVVTGGAAGVGGNAGTSGAAGAIGAW